MQNNEPFSNALQLFAAEARACATEMLRNSSYIEGELDRVTMTDELRGVTKRMCHSLAAAGKAAIGDLSGSNDNSFSAQELAQRANDIVNLLSRDLSGLHGLVIALRAESNMDLRFTLGSILVEESATNILHACNRAADAAKAVSDAAATV